MLLAERMIGGDMLPDRLARLAAVRWNLNADQWKPLIGALAMLTIALALAIGIGLTTRSDTTDAFVLQSADGARFVAEVQGAGNDWVLLGHMYRTKNTNPTDRHIWNRFEARLVKAGFRVLSWDFRCHGDSPCVYSGRKIEDVPDIHGEWEAAIDYALGQAAERLFGVGVSMGGTSLMQVAAYRTEFTAISAISSPNIFPNKAPKDSERGGEDFDRLDGLSNVADIGVPKLYMVGARNQCSFWQSDRYYQRSSEPVRLVIYDTDLHGTEILDDETIGPDAQQELLDFLRDPSSVIGREKLNLAPDADPDEECWPPEESEDE